MAQSSNVSAGQDANASQYNNLRADLFAAHHQDPAGVKIVNADINDSAAIALSKLASLTANRALVTNGSGVIAVSGATATEVGYLSGIVSKPVSNSGDETISGIKTFGSIPVLPASDPTSGNQAVRKAYVDAYYATGIVPKQDTVLSYNCDFNIDIPITVGFQPRIIKLKYFMWGIAGAYPCCQFGEVVFSGTSILYISSQFGNQARYNGSNYPFYIGGNDSNAKHYLDIDETNQSYLIAGDLSSSYWATAWRNTMSLLSVISTGFTIRLRIQAQSQVSGAVSDIFHATYEVFR